MIQLETSVNENYLIDFSNNIYQQYIIIDLFYL
jgi:hypothetical protein